MVKCPGCGTPIDPTWDWCHGCGFDPEGLKPAGWQPSAVPPGPTPAGGRFAPTGPTGPTGPTAASAWTAPQRPPSPPAGQPFGPMGYPAPAYTGPTPKSGAGAKVALVLGGMGLAFVLMIVVLVGAVTLLGRSSSSKFSSIATAIPDDASPAFATTTTTSAVGPTWTEWQPDDRSFTISFPSEFPVVDTAELSNEARVKLRNAWRVHDEWGDELFRLYYMDPVNGYYIPDPVGALDVSVESVMASLELTFTKRDHGQFAGMPSLEFAGTGSIGGLEVQVIGIGIVSGARVYFFVGMNVNNEPPAHFKAFLESFHIT